MSIENQTDGSTLYANGDTQTREWFEQQWKIWPKRANEKFTTNISFHYGGVLAYRSEHGREPELSSDFASHVQWHDKNNATG